MRVPRPPHPWTASRLAHPLTGRRRRHAALAPPLLSTPFQRTSPTIHFAEQLDLWTSTRPMASATRVRGPGDGALALEAAELAVLGAELCRDEAAQSDARSR